MTALLLDGKHVASIHREALQHQLLLRNQAGLGRPGLAVVLIGDDAASTVYVKNKRKACEDIGITSFSYDLKDDISQEELLSLIDTLNCSPEVNGILVQLPLPKHIDQFLVIERINPEKDVDGFHPYNLGRLAQKNPMLRPCTPRGVMQLLDHYQLKVQGMHAVVIGASNIVGRPMSLELLLAGATVTVCHRFTSSLQPFVESADIIVVATGTIDVINTSWLKTHQILIDVGMHRLADGSLRGDVDFQKAKEQVAYITPVPGGVGPMTIISLMENTLEAARIQDSNLE